MNWEEAVIWLRNQPDQKELVCACYFDDPLIEVVKRYYIEDEWKSLRLLLPNSPGSVLDVGAGRGISSYALAMDGWTVTALEPNPSNLIGAGAIRQIVSETNLPITIIEEWGEHLPFEDNIFDVIHARQVLHHAQDLNQLCKELFRVIKPGGTMIATREHVIDKIDDLPIFLNNHPLHRLYGGENAYTLHQYIMALRESGFTVKKIFSPYETPINYFPEKKERIDEIIGHMVLGKLWRKWIPIPNFFIKIVDSQLSTPGRLYSFLLIKK
jgi:ubiquinone/menaquinone biosynthesis C-methylase UbiE